MEDNYYFWGALSLTTLMIGAASIILQNTLLLGLMLPAAYLLYRKSVKVARFKGQTENSKILHAFTGNLIEFLGISLAIFFTEAWPIVFALTVVGFREAFSREIKDKMKTSNTEILGRTERISILSITFLASYFNQYLLIYGLLLVGLMALVETGRQIFFLIKNR